MTISDLYSFSKALHLIGMVSWMAGVFYLVRIMVNHAEAFHRPAPEGDILARQYALMEQKAYRIIIQPAVVITWTFGVLMLCIQPVWLEQGWMHAKLLLLLGFTGYTHYCKGHIRRLADGRSTFTHVHYRALNEVPTLFMAGIIFLAVFKTNLNWSYFFFFLGLFAGLLYYAIQRVAKRMGN